MPESNFRPVGEGVSRTAHAHVSEESDSRHSTNESLEQREENIGGE